MSDQSASGTERWTNDVHQGDVTETLAEMPESSVHCVITSPPYFGLRDYGVDGQIGLEDSLDEYIDTLVDVGRELRRVLRDDGVWWLNLGDSFASKPRGNNNPGESTGLNNNAESFDAQDSGQDTTGEFGKKQKMLVPHRVAIALQDSGWFVRSDAIWSKPNPMPSPVKDRLNEQKEFLFQLTPSADYWFDLDAIREPHSERSLERTGRCDKAARGFPGKEQTMDPEQFCHPHGKNPGDVLEVTVKPFPEAHFAVYPPELVETPLKASCPPVVCAGCGTPYERQVERTSPPKHEGRDNGNRLDESEAGNVGEGGLGPRFSQMSGQEYVEWKREHPDRFDGWSQECDCDTDETEPGIVLDPFAGAGTTCVVAKDLGRRFIGIDLNPDYVALAQKRAGVTVDEPERLLEDDDQATLVQTDGGCNGRSVDTATDQSEGGSE